MKELLLLRHAKSSWKDTSLGDHDRPLNKRGRAASTRMGQLLADEGIIPDHVLCSTAKRTRQTAKRALKAAGYGGEVTFREELYHASAAEIMQEVARVSDDVERLLVIAHNPGMEVLTGRLTEVYHRFPTGALMHVRYEDLDTWRSAPGRQATLLGVWLPRMLME